MSFVAETNPEYKMEEHVCPVWVGYLLASPLRKLFCNPEKMLSPYVKEGMTVVDYGSAMGFFSLPLARMVGASGKVICVDIQEKMLEKLEKRAKKAGLSDRIETCLVKENARVLEHYQDAVDFTLASAVLHEVPDVKVFFDEVYCVLKKGGELLIVEPDGRVKKEEFEKNLSIGQQKSFEIVERPQIKRSLSALLKKE